MEQVAANECVFVGEGNAHVVVRNGDKVLKLKKRHESFDREIRYISDVIDPLLSASYRSLGGRQLVMLTRNFIRSLNEEIWSHRPASRRDTAVIDINNEYGMEENDATRMIRWFPKSNNVALEIKVKCGLKCSSPFYYNYGNNNDRLFKLQFSRYELKQIYKTKTSNGSFTPRTSDYNPCDLCSMNSVKVATSLTNLYDCPQNNFKVISSDRGVLRDGAGTNEIELSNHLIEYFGSSCVAEGLIPVVSTIFSRESILAEVQQLQGLDVLDVEGVSLVYAMLLSTLGSQTAVLEKIHAYTLPTADILSIMKRNVSDPASHVKLFLALKSLQAASSDSEETIASRYHQALHLLHAASVDDCIFLIHLYLLALTMKDASIIIAFTVKEHQHASGFELLESCHVHTTQSYSDAGLVTVRTGQGMMDLHYRITLCDIGPKPISKIINKQDDERKMCHLIYSSVAL